MAFLKEEWRRADFVNEADINAVLNKAATCSTENVLTIINKAENCQGLDLAETAALLAVKNLEVREEVLRSAGRIKESIYGRRVVVFAPLYISDYCVNNCVYCGYKVNNQFKRRKLTESELRKEVRILESMGHKRLAVEAGEDPVNCPLSYVLDCLRIIYEEKSARGGDIRRCNVNIAATTIKEYKQLNEAGIGTYILFQETYHRDTYKSMHNGGPKADYDWHTMAHSRAMLAGIDDVGFGVLFGLYDWRFEVLAMLQHARQLEKDFGVGPHTISVPRIKPATGQSEDVNRWAVTDDDFVYLTAILRLAVPYTGIILSTRETAEIRHKLLKHGVSQISVGSCTGVGGYSRRASKDEETVMQFCVEDNRGTGEVLLSLCEQGWIPSFCTGCYRQGRTGDRFMQLAKSGEISNVCQPNAILTLKEFLLDYADDDLRRAGEKTINENLSLIKDDLVRNKVIAELMKLEQGKRDLYF